MGKIGDLIEAAVANGGKVLVRYEDSDPNWVLGEEDGEPALVFESATVKMSMNTDHDALPGDQAEIVIQGLMPQLLHYVSTGDRTYESLLGETLFLGKTGGLTTREPDKPAQVISVGFVITGRGDVYISPTNPSAKQTEVLEGQCKFCRAAVHETSLYCCDCIQMMDHANEVVRSQPLSEEFRKWTVRVYNKMAPRFEKTCTDCNARDGTVRPDADELNWYCQSCAMELTGNSCKEWKNEGWE